MSVWIKNPDVVLREEVIEGALLFNPDTNQVRLLNATGLFIWQLCDGKNDASAIVNALQEKFDGIPSDQVANQVEEFLNAMTAFGLIGTVEK